MKKKQTSQAQLNAVQRYQDKQKPIVIRYPTEKREEIKEAVKEAGKTHKQVFEKGLKAFKINVEL